MKHIWAIRTTLQLNKRIRDLALFNLAVDSKLRGCDVVNLKVEDVAPHGYAIGRATVRQKKTGRLIYDHNIERPDARGPGLVIQKPIDAFEGGGLKPEKGTINGNLPFIPVD